jgi:hypothetical protein
MQCPTSRAIAYANVQPACRSIAIIGRFCHTDILVRQFRRILFTPPCERDHATYVSPVSPQCSHTLPRAVHFGMTLALFIGHAWRTCIRTIRTEGDRRQ